MSLFNIKELAIKEEETGQPAFRASIRTRQQVGKSLLSLQSTIGELQHDESIQYATGGRWSLHQLLEYLLIKTGPAKIWMTTWTITEEPMRALLDLINRDLIIELNAVLDYRIERRKPEAFQLASNIISRIKLTKCHAKVLVVRNSEWDVTVLGSANFSKNPRIEAGVIFTDRKSAAFHSHWIDDIIEGKEVFHVK